MFIWAGTKEAKICCEDKYFVEAEAIGRIEKGRKGRYNTRNNVPSGQKARGD
jgi:hypothetical protein